MKFGKIFKAFKKGSKAAAKQGKKGAAVPSQWPSGTRIGIFGHANSGKTVYFTVLNEDCKISKRLQISVTDTTTAGEFLTNYRSIWGLGTSGEAGTVVDFRGEKKFPDPTEVPKILQFNAIVDRSIKLSVVSYEYSGNAVSISRQNDAAEAVADFMKGCDGILFFFDPKILGAELESQAHVASFVNLLENIAPLSSARLPIPVGLVISKADILPGFKGEEQITLVSPQDEYLFSEDFEFFLEKVLSSPKVASDSAWSGSVRTTLVRMKDFLRVVLGRTLDFQIFFISATGVTPEKIGTDVGRSIYAPPNKMQPIGVKEPFYWLLNGIIRNKRISRFRKLSKLVTIASLIWIVIFSLPYFIHFAFLYPKPIKTEKRIITEGRDIFNISTKEQREIINAYNRYKNSFLTKNFFSEFQAPTQRIIDMYDSDRLTKARQELNAAIDQFKAVVGNQELWPVFINPADTAPVLLDNHKQILSVFQTYHQGDSTSELYTRSGRVLDLWKLFLRGVADPDNPGAWADVQNKVKTDGALYAEQLNRNEKELGDALSGIKVKTETKQEIKETTTGLGDLIATINASDSPRYLLSTAPDELRRLRGKVDAASESKISAYLKEVNKWKNARIFKYKVTSIPDGAHLHIEVVPKGKEPIWSGDNGEQIVKDWEYKLSWKLGDEIHIAYDVHDLAAEKWGKEATDRRTLRGDYAIFEFSGDISFPSGVKVSVTIDPDPKTLLPKMEE